jgi:hypothetical protein
MSLRKKESDILCGIKQQLTLTDSDDKETVFVF